MLKLWMVLYTSQGVGATWGPLPYDIDECRRRLEVGQTAIVDFVLGDASKPGSKVPKEVIDSVRTWRMKCEIHASRPKLDQ